MLITSGSLKVKGFLYIFKIEFVITFITPCILWFFIGLFCLNKVYIVYLWLLYLTWQELHNKIIKELRKPKKRSYQHFFFQTVKVAHSGKNVNKFQVMWLTTRIGNLLLTQSNNQTAISAVWLVGKDRLKVKCKKK